MPNTTALRVPIREISSDPGTAAIANIASGNPIRSSIWVSDMCSSLCTSGITGGMARMLMRMATPASQSANMNRMRRPVVRPSRLSTDDIEEITRRGALTCMTGKSRARSGMMQNCQCLSAFYGGNAAT